MMGFFSSLFKSAFETGLKVHLMMSCQKDMKREGSNGLRMDSTAEQEKKLQR